MAYAPPVNVHNPGYYSSGSSSSSGGSYGCNNSCNSNYQSGYNNQSSGWTSKVYCNLNRSYPGYKCQGVDYDGQGRPCRARICDKNGNKKTVSVTRNCQTSYSVNGYYY